MQDVIKVFVDVPNIQGYVQTTSEPFAAQFVFTSSIEYHVVKNDTITSSSVPWQYNAAPGVSPGTVYATLYSDILAHAALMDYPTPGQTDVFCWVPTALSQIFTEIPSLS